MEVERVLQATSSTLTKTFMVDGIPTAATGVLITITRADGTVLVAPTAPTAGAGTGQFLFTLTPTHTALLDTLTATWTGTINAQVQTLKTTVEIAGGFLFSIADVRADSDLADTNVYTVDKINEARLYAETEIEKKCGVAFVPRYRLKRFSGDGTGRVILGPRVRAVRSVTVTGVAASLVGLSIDGVGIYSTIPWTRGYGNLLVGYEHGHDNPPESVRRAALVVAKDQLVNKQFDDRSIQQATELGPVYLNTPGWRGNRFGLSEVDAVCEAYTETVLVG